MTRRFVLTLLAAALIAAAGPATGQSISEIQRSLQSGQINARNLDPSRTVVPQVDTAYAINPNTNVAFKAGKPVQFYKSGFAAAGTLAAPVSLYYNGKDKVGLAASTEVWFYDTSFVWRGTLAANQAFLVNPRDSVSRAAGSVVIFTPEGFLMP